MNKKLVLQKLCLAANELDGNKFKKEVDAITLIMKRVAGMYDESRPKIFDEYGKQLDDKQLELRETENRAMHDVNPEQDYDINGNVIMMPIKNKESSIYLQQLRDAGIQITDPEMQQPEILKAILEAIYPNYGTWKK